MGDIAIRVEGISKQYYIGPQERYRTFRDTLTQACTVPLRRAARLLRGQAHAAAELSEPLWALQEVSFEVERGEVLGIIGRNGAGKSTLLKILSRITEPTRGFAEIHGRVGSLLEVGTGFHPELTGRENIYLNGAVLGMRRVEIQRKFDEIVAFSEVEKFLDTPVKHFSSGMQMRLAFAVAAHLEPEILIVDEVLAVGDARFQRKCVAKMQDVGRQGRTVLFVSHNMPAVNLLCTRAMLLAEGRVAQDGMPAEVVNHYLSEGTGSPARREWPDPNSAPGGEVARLRAVRVVSRAGEVLETVGIREEVGLQMVYDVLQSGHVLLPHYYLYNEDGVIVFGTLDQDPTWRHRPRPAGRYVSTAWIPGNLLSEGRLYVSCCLITRLPDVVQFGERQVIAFMVADNMGEGTARGDWGGTMIGVVRPLLPWTTQFSKDIAEPIDNRRWSHESELAQSSRLTIIQG
jgi:lipopolysaccharide transport system ATP-binding protein